MAATLQGGRPRRIPLRAHLPPARPGDDAGVRIRHFRDALRGRHHGQAAGDVDHAWRSSPSGWQWSSICCAEYQLERLEGFFSPNEQTLEVNYNQNQSQIAIGSGGMFGQGLFEGTQTNLAFVPSQTTDFIFTAVAEQLGFVGGTLVIGLYAALIWRMLMVALVARDRFGQLAATGIAAMFGFHVFVNIGMAVGLLPVTGLPLPFLSFGGSFYLGDGGERRHRQLDLDDTQPVPGGSPNLRTQTFPASVPISRRSC
jgi:hypothetical protein